MKVPTITVGELIAELQKYPLNADVRIGPLTAHRNLGIPIGFDLLDWPDRQPELSIFTQTEADLLGREPFTILEVVAAL